MGLFGENVRPISGASQIAPHVTVVAKVNVDDESDLSGYQLPAPPSAEDFHLILTDDATGKTAEWNSLSEFNRASLYHNGEYTMMAYHGQLLAEGFDVPCYAGVTKFVLDERSLTKEVDITCALTCALFDVKFNPELASVFSKFGVVLHSDGGGYIDYPMSESRPAFINGGRVYLCLDLTLPDGRSTRVAGAMLGEVKPNCYYRATISLADDGDGEGRNVKISFRENQTTDDIIVPITEDLFTAEPPRITALGFNIDEPCRIAEGGTTESPLLMTVNSSSLESLILTTCSVGSLFDGWPAEIDLLKMTSAEMDTLAAHGFKMSDVSGNGLVLDFTELVSNMRFKVKDSVTEFYLIARNRNGELSNTANLTVVIEPVDIEIVSVSPIVMGLNIGELTINAPSGDIERNLRIEYLDNHNKWVEASGVNIADAPGYNFNLRFEVPDGTAPVTARLYYCGVMKKEFTMQRVAPEYTFDIDAYAHKANIRLSASDSRFLDLLTSGMQVYVNGQRGAVIDRDETSGMITLGGLSENRTYTVRLTMAQRPLSDADFSAPRQFTTEPMAGLPNGDFEDVKSSIDYKNMLSGGRYSQNFVEIFNEQNYTTFALSTPKKWANTNSKTFSSAAKNKNTWYMQPSVYTVADAASGSYAVKIVSVGWDIDGPEIPDYLQESRPFVRYSRNVPQVAFAAVGKLFLGSYSFDPFTLTETYGEGMKINSRPSALNGYYKFQPGENMPDDCGLARIDVIGEVDGAETVIASGSAMLRPAATYAAFSVPLEYTFFGVKATRLRVMLASSVHAGTIIQETNSLNLTADMATSSSTASELWVDNVTLSY